MNYHFCTYFEKKQRVDIYLSSLFSQFSRSYIQRLIDNGAVTVNGEIVKKNIKIAPRDEVYLECISEPTNLAYQDMNLDVIYEDNEILIINKEAWINVHPVPGSGGRKGTLVNAILFHCQCKLPSIRWIERPGIVHRLDKNTSGAIMVAKTDTMMTYLSDAIKERNIDKYYLAVVQGIMPNEPFTIESYIGRDPHDRKKMTSESPLHPKIALTHGTVEQYIDGAYTLVKLKIVTGRTHQIRVHLSSIGYPIIGDSVYATDTINAEVLKKYGLTRQALHACEIGIELYGKKHVFQAPLKPDMRKIIW